jgi:hypothetical protein
MQIDIEKNKEMIIKLLESVNRKGIEELIEWLKLSDFFTAPASSKFHLACKGGLAAHSLSVCKVLEKLVDSFWLGTKIPGDSLILVGLLHDVCKVGIYVWSDSQQKYIHEDPFPIGHGDKSVMVLQEFIKLTCQEIAMIRWHMGPYDESYNRGEKYIVKYYPECKLVYFADDISTQYLEK